MKSPKNATANAEYQADFDTLAAALNTLQDRLQNMVYTAPGLAIGSAAKAKILIANTINYSVDGLMYTKATAEVAFTATTHDLADGYEAYYYLTINAAGTVTVTMGTEALSTVGATLDWSEAGAGTIIGAVHIATSGAAFDAGTTELDAATVTDTYYDAAGAVVLFSDLEKYLS